MQREGGVSSPLCIPTKGLSNFSVKWNSYEWHFLSKENQLKFEQNPVLYAPKAGGFCAFSLTGDDPNGAGFWCACTNAEDGYAFVDNSLFFFLYSGAKESFLRNISRSLEGVSNHWSVLLRENARVDLECFNTRRFVSTLTDDTVNGRGDCALQDCMKWINCSDCDGGSGLV